MEYAIQIASAPDREQVVAEVWYGEDMIAEINQEGPELAILLFPIETMLDLNLLLEAIQRAAQRLRGEITPSS